LKIKTKRKLKILIYVQIEGFVDKIFKIIIVEQKLGIGSRVCSYCRSPDFVIEILEAKPIFYSSISTKNGK